LDNLKQFLNGDQHVIYTTLENEVQNYKNKCSSMLQRQAELEDELISMKVSFYFIFFQFIFFF